MTSDSHIPACVLTAPRAVETLGRTILSLKNAGFEQFYIYYDKNRRGIWPGYLTLAERSLEMFGTSGPLLLVEDDILVCRDLHDYVTNSMDWVMEGSNAFISLYLNTWERAKNFSGAGHGVHESSHLEGICGALAWLWNPKVLRQMIFSDDLFREDRMGTDIHAPKWLRAKGYRIFHHLPSLVQHADGGCSTYGCRHGRIYRYADTFIGETNSCQKPEWD